MADKIVTVGSTDIVRIDVVGEARAVSIPASEVLRAIQAGVDPESSARLAKSVLQVGQILYDLKAFEPSNPERSLRKFLGHYSSLLVDARLLLGLEPIVEDMCKYE